MATPTEGQFPGLIFPFFVQILGVVVLFILERYPRIPIPYAAIMFCLGAMMGALAYKSESDDLLSTSIRTWSRFDGDLLLLVFLPGLIFRDAIEVNFHMFLAAFGQLLTLAFPVVVAGTFLTATVGVYVLPYDLPWPLALTLGSILASTDPVAVSSLLKSAGAPPRLQMHVGGESLLNDGSAVVVYSIFSEKFLYLLDPDKHPDIGWQEGVEIFFKMSLGGTAIGIAFAGGLMILLYVLHQKVLKENDTLQVTAAISAAYLSYYVADVVAGTSGVLSCVFCGVISAAFGKGLITDPELMDSYLSLMEHFLNTLLFALGGVVWGDIINNDGNRAVHIAASDWGWMVVLYLFVMLIRVIQVVAIYPIMKRIGLKTSWKESVFMVHGGLRGAVGIALAISLDSSVRKATTDTHWRNVSNQVIALSGAVTCLTLLVNGTTSGHVLRLLGLAKPTTSRLYAVKVFKQDARKFLIRELHHLLQDERFKDASFDVIQSHVPFLSDATEEQMRDEVASRRSSTFSVARSVTHRTPNEIFERQRTMDLVAWQAEEDGLETQLRNSKVGKREVEEEVILYSVRQIFFELLDDAYSELIHRGELDPRDDSGYNVDILRQSVEIACDKCRQGEPIQDWKYTHQMFPNLDQFKWRVLHWFMFLLPKRTHLPFTGEYQSRRVTFLRCIIFMEAHRIAEMKMKSYLEHESILCRCISGAESPDQRRKDMVHDAILKVVEESRAQVALAKTNFAEFAQKDEMDIFVSHYACRICLRKLRKFVEEKAEDGVLTEKEAALYIEQFERNLKEVAYCTMPHTKHGTSQRNIDGQEHGKES